MSTLGRVESWLSGVVLDEAGLVNAEIARTLAGKLDAVGEDGSGAAAMAISGIAKELRAVIDEIRTTSGDRQEFVTDLFS